MAADLLATCASIVETTLPNDAGEDSYDILPAFRGQARSEPIREATIHHAGDGSFSIRQGKWKLELCRGSGGWSAPTNVVAREEKLPAVQLYDLEQDISEQRNVQYPQVVDSLIVLLDSYKTSGRSVPLRSPPNSMSR